MYKVKSKYDPWLDQTQHAYFIYTYGFIDTESSINLFAYKAKQCRTKVIKKSCQYRDLKVYVSCHVKKKIFPALFIIFCGALFYLFQAAISLRALLGPTLGVFCWDHLNQHWRSNITQILVYKSSRWILDQSGFIYFFDVP